MNKYNIAAFPDGGLHYRMTLTKYYRELREEQVKIDNNNDAEPIHRPLPRVEQSPDALHLRPVQNVRVEHPRGLLNPLTDYQSRVLAWMLQRETKQPPGGFLESIEEDYVPIIAALVLTDKQRHQRLPRHTNANGKLRGGTLIVCKIQDVPHWKTALQNHCEVGHLKIHCYSGIARQTKAQLLVTNNLVIASSSLLSHDDIDKQALFDIEWERVITMEIMKNYNTKTWRVLCSLCMCHRWMLVKNEVKNNVAAMFWMLKYLQCPVSDTIETWKHWVKKEINKKEQRRILEALNELHF